MEFGECMKREVDINEISDGKRYTSNDMVRIDCKECMGCSACCKGMENSIQLDPYDLYELERGLQMNFEELLQQYLDLHVVDGLILPNIRMQGSNEQCPFLNEQGRCRIHSFRPGVCRLFPLGRIYENSRFYYFYQIRECDYPDKSKVKIRKWLGIPQLSKYEDYILTYHNLQKRFQKILAESENEELKKSINLSFLDIFYVNQYDVSEGGKDFYSQFEERIQQSKVWFPTS